MKNYLTTFTGLIGAIAIALLPIVQGQGFNWNSILIAAVVAALGFFAKSYNVTGVGVGARTEGDLEEARKDYQQ